MDDFEIFVLIKKKLKTSVARIFSQNIGTYVINPTSHPAKFDTRSFNVRDTYESRIIHGHHKKINA